MRRQILFTVEKKRVLVPVGEPCPFGCRYCYTRNGAVGLERVKAEDILKPFSQFAREADFETIQFGYDGDPFTRPERGITMLKELATMGKHVNFSTKAFLHGPVLDALNDIRAQMEAARTVLSALVSLSCWDSAANVEPHTPSPAERVQTIANLKYIGIPVFIAVRPILPHIADSEYERIADEGIRVGCEGFILGPLYADAKGRYVRFIPPAVLAQVPGRAGKVSWSAHAPEWTRYEDTERLQQLLLMIERKGGRTFLSSADAVALANSAVHA
ncbi:MAG TPA: radical SAM protein [Ktedonobacteraceae bacterium]|jgi:DNA repair photolyase|nr:radical SAM protein [Ktedonobacteraceae bacterium]